MTREEIVEVVSAYKTAFVTGRKYGIGSGFLGIHRFKLDDLKLAVEIYGGRIKYYDDGPKPFHALDIGEVTLYT